MLSANGSLAISGASLWLEALKENARKISATNSKLVFRHGTGRNSFVFILLSLGNGLNSGLEKEYDFSFWAIYVAQECLGFQRRIFFIKNLITWKGRGCSGISEAFNDWPKIINRKGRIFADQRKVAYSGRGRNDV